MNGAQVAVTHAKSNLDALEQIDLVQPKHEKTFLGQAFLTVGGNTGSSVLSTAEQNLRETGDPPGASVVHREAMCGDIQQTINTNSCLVLWRFIIKGAQWNMRFKLCTCATASRLSNISSAHFRWRAQWHCGIKWTTAGWRVRLGCGVRRVHVELHCWRNMQLIWCFHYHLPAILRPIKSARHTRRFTSHWLLSAYRLVSSYYFWAAAERKKSERREGIRSSERLTKIRLQRGHQVKYRRSVQTLIISVTVSFPFWVGHLFPVPASFGMMHGHIPTFSIDNADH